jgi:hypothetical protein
LTLYPSIGAELESIRRLLEKTMRDAPDAFMH